MSYLLKQSQTTRPLLFLMVQSTDHLTGVTGITPTVTLSKNGAAFASPAGTVTEIANGWYKVAANATDTGTLGPLLLHASGSGADPSDVQYEVVSFDPEDAVRGGLTALPNAAAGASGGLGVRDANGNVPGVFANTSAGLGMYQWVPASASVSSISGSKAYITFVDYNPVTAFSIGIPVTFTFDNGLSVGTIYQRDGGGAYVNLPTGSGVGVASNLYMMPGKADVLNAFTAGTNTLSVDSSHRALGDVRAWGGTTQTSVPIFPIIPSGVLTIGAQAAITLPLGSIRRFTIFTANPTSGAAQNADSTPTVTVKHNGTLLGSLVPTLTNIATGQYEVTYALSTGNGFADGDQVQETTNVLVSTVPATGVTYCRIDSAVSTLAAAGTGDTPVNHNTGGADNLRLEIGTGSNAAGFDGAQVRAYLLPDYSGSNLASAYLKGSTVTGPVNSISGRMPNPLMLQSNGGSNTYVIAFYRSGSEHKPIATNSVSI